MSRLLRPAAVLLVLLLLGWALWVPLDRAYFRKRAELRQRLVSLGGNVDRYEAGVDDHARVKAQLREFADRTLGGDRETVDHRLRSRLNRIGEQLGLEGLSVGTGRIRHLESPAKRVFPRRSPLRDEIDFAEVEGWVSGRGSFAQAVALVGALRAEPWLKRIDQVRLQPRDNAAGFNVTVRLVTLYLPGRTPPPLPPPGPAPAVPPRFKALVARNPFRVPEAPAAPPQAVAEPPAPATRLERWVLTGVASLPSAAEVWLRHRDSGETRRLAVGERLEGLVLLSASGDRAVFALGDERFEVPVGARLTDGGPVGP